MIAAAKTKSVERSQAARKKKILSFLSEKLQQF
jgi:hypothetical protein